MEKNANYALVGALALVLVIGLVGFTVWLAGAQFNREYDFYRIVFRESVQGLSQGGEVYYNGIRVGEVTELELDANDPNRVVARVRLGADTPVKTDSVAQLEPLGITGVNIIQISAGAPRSRLLKDTVPENAVPTIRSRPGPLAGLLSGGGTVLERAVEALENVNAILGEQNRRQLELILGNVEGVSAQLNRQDGLIADTEAAIANADLAAANVARLAADASQLVDSSNTLVNRDVAATVREAQGAAEQLRLAATDARQLVADLKAPATDFATTGLPQLTQSLVSLQEAAESLDRVVSQIGQNPRSLITTGEGVEREVAP